VLEYQGKGVDGAIILFFTDTVRQKNFNYKEIQMNWIGDFNEPMMKVVDGIAATIYKTHVTYRLLFDPNKPFTRAKRQHKDLD
jgi:hypothetical protein